MHWEQPKRSLMFYTPLLREVFEKTHAAMFDMCNVGHLRDPDNYNKPYYPKGTLCENGVHEVVRSFTWPKLST